MKDDSILEDRIILDKVAIRVAFGNRCSGRDDYIYVVTDNLDRFLITPTGAIIAQEVHTKEIYGTECRASLEGERLVIYSGYESKAYDARIDIDKNIPKRDAEAIIVTCTQPPTNRRAA